MVRRSDRRCREDAAQWAVRLDDERDSITPTELERLHDFLRNSRNAKEYTATSRILLMVDCLRDRDRERLSAWADAHQEPRARRRPKLWAMAASILVVLVIGGDSSYLGPWYRDVFTARAGETRGVQLNLGSAAVLSAGSQLRKIGDDKECRYEVMRGEVLFEFTPSALHPCRVSIGSSEIRVLGTRFNVRRDSDDHVIVSVLQGVVEVRALGQRGATADWSHILRANEQLQYQLPGVTRTPGAVQENTAARSRDERHKFDHESVEAVVAKLSHYTSTPILIHDPRAAALRVGGALNVADVQGSLRSLEGMAPIRVSKEGGIFTIDYRPETDEAKN